MDGGRKNKRRGRGYNNGGNRGRGGGPSNNGDQSTGQQAQSQASRTAAGGEEPVASATSVPLQSSQSTGVTGTASPAQKPSVAQPTEPAKRLEQTSAPTSASSPAGKEASDTGSKSGSDKSPGDNSKDSESPKNVPEASARKSSVGGSAAAKEDTIRKVSFGGLEESTRVTETKVESPRKVSFGSKEEVTAKTPAEQKEEVVRKVSTSAKEESPTKVTPATKEETPARKSSAGTKEDTPSRKLSSSTPAKDKQEAEPAVVQAAPASGSVQADTSTKVPSKKEDLVKNDMSSSPASSTPVKAHDQPEYQTPMSGQNTPVRSSKEEAFATPESGIRPDTTAEPSTAESTPTTALQASSSSGAKAAKGGPPAPPKKKSKDQSSPVAKDPELVTPAKQGGGFGESTGFETPGDPYRDELVSSARRGSIGGKLGYMGSFGAGSNISTVGTIHGMTDTEETLANRSTSSQAPSVFGFTKRQVATLLVFSFANFFSAVLISLQAPFYPQEAEAKGATATEYGLVFGVFELVVFITSPIYGKYLQKVGPKVVFNVGIITTGLTTIAFGFLDRIDDRTLFITLSFVVRIIEATADAAFITASFAIIATEFPESVATTFASLETFFGLGLIVGPTLGGALYQTGGFTLPFAVMGGLVLLVGFLAFFVMPNPKPIVDDGKEVPGGVLSILRVPGVALAAFSIISASISVGFLNSTLEPHIRQFALTPVLTGLIFIINGGLYAITAPGWGWICDRVAPPRYIGLVGAVAVFIGFLFIGPAPFIPLDTVLWLTCIGLVIHGIGLGATLVSSFILALRESVSHGFADNIHTYGLTSALWTSSFAFGAFVGPSVGGILLDQVGFRLASVFVLGVQLVLTLLITAFIARQRSAARGFKESNMESAPLLKNGSDDPSSSKAALENNGQEGYQKKGTGYGAV